MVTIHRAKGICMHPGCNTIIAAREKGYCAKHKKPDYRAKLDKNKAPGAAKFYSSHAWQKARNFYIKEHPYCEQCKREKGIIVISSVVHHTTERSALLAAGESPLDSAYLESICSPCHQRELRKRKLSKSQRKKFYWE